MNGTKLLIQGINELGIQITDQQVARFLKYYEMLVEINKVMNRHRLLILMTL